MTQGTETDRRNQRLLPKAPTVPERRRSIHAPAWQHQWPRKAVLQGGTGNCESFWHLCPAAQTTTTLARLHCTAMLIIGAAEDERVKP
jgi:hypothetical protein